MGYSLLRFVEQVDPNLLCPVCQYVCEAAVLTACGHTFCQSCLDRWMQEHQQSQTCPQCRQIILMEDTRPIWSIRNLIDSLTISCPEEKCTQIIRLENLSKHLEFCEFAQEQCRNCDKAIPRHELENHQRECTPIRMEVDLEVRVSSLERHVKRIREDLKAAEFKNDFLERELQRTRSSIQDRRQELQDQNADDLNSEMLKLSNFIARFLLRKPGYVDRNRVFTDIQKHFLENSSNENEEKRTELHMLLATANASDWFTGNQKIHFDMWMMDLVRFRPATAGHLV